MTKARTIWIAALAALASLVLLVPAGSAQAAYRSAPFCGSLNPGGGYDPMTLKPGQVCTFWPVAVNQFGAAWDIVKPGSGAVCLAVIKYPPGWPNGTVLAPSGGPGGWACNGSVASKFACCWYANNAFGAVHGQAAMLNYSTATIRTAPSRSAIWYFG